MMAEGRTLDVALQLSGERKFLWTEPMMARLFTNRGGTIEGEMQMKGTNMNEEMR